MVTKKKNPLRDALEKNSIELKTAFRRSRDWYNQQVMLMARQRITPPQLLQRKPNDMRKRIYPGYMYMFMYNPKHRKTLPYYDKFPLVIPWQTVPGGFMGLNMHYLPYQYRLILLERLYEFRTNDKMNETTKLKLSYETISETARLKLAKPCIKHYLNSHVTSQFRRIEVTDWATALLLPVERFQKESKEKVWQDSLNKIN